MNIAIIDDEPVFHNIIGEKIKESCYDCNIDFFHDSSDFGKCDLNKFDIIISDNRLPNIAGRDLLRAISSKTKADLILVSAYDKDFITENVVEDYITGFVSKDNMDSLLDQVKYINAKIRINKLLDKEEARIANLIKYNGCSIEMNGNIMIIGLSNALNDKTRGEIEDRITNSTYTGIVFFSEESIIGSVLMKELIYFYKLFKDKNKKFCFWNAYKQVMVKSLLSSCNLDRLIKIFENIDEAMRYLSE